MKRKRISVVVLLIAAFILVGMLTPEKQTNKCVSAAGPSSVMEITPITDWQEFMDREGKISLSYPTEWDVEETITQDVPYFDAEAIINRYTFLGSAGMIDLDIWLANDMDLIQWAEYYSKARYPVHYQFLYSNSQGDPYIVYLEKGGTIHMLSAFFSDGEYIYRLWYGLSNEVGMQVFTEMLSSVNFGKDGQNQSYSMPSKVIDETEEMIDLSSKSLPAQPYCCYVYYSPPTPFNCCDDKGNCVWWVYYKYGSVPFRGHAWQWWGQVPLYAYWHRGSSPNLYNENIAYWSKTSKPDVGHVAYIPYYSGGSSVSFTQMSYCGNCVTSDTEDISEVDGFIWWSYKDPLSLEGD